MDITEARIGFENCQGWTDGLFGQALQIGHGAMVKMGTFAQPLAEMDAGMTWSQWQAEKAKRLLVAALEYLDSAG